MGCGGMGGYTCNSYLKAHEIVIVVTRSVQPPAQSDHNKTKSQRPETFSADRKIHLYRVVTRFRVYDENFVYFTE